MTTLRPFHSVVGSVVLSWVRGYGPSSWTRHFSIGRATYKTMQILDTQFLPLIQTSTDSNHPNLLLYCNLPKRQFPQPLVNRLLPSIHQQDIIPLPSSSLPPLKRPPSILPSTTAARHASHHYLPRPFNFTDSQCHSIHYDDANIDALVRRRACCYCR